MRSSFWLTTLFAATFFLAACGGDGGETVSDAPVNTSSLGNTTCTLSLSVYANSSTQGYRIQQGGTPTPAVPRQLDSCAITTLESARLGICIKHDDISELNAQLTLPVIASVQAPWTRNPTPLEEDKKFCDLNQGTIYVMDIPINVINELASLPSMNAMWNVAVADNVQNNKTGFFVSWSLLLSGKK